MATIKGNKVQVTFLLNPEEYEQVKDAKWETRASAGEVMREAVSFFFSELNQRNPRHPMLTKHGNPPQYVRDPTDRRRFIKSA